MPLVALTWSQNMLQVPDGTLLLYVLTWSQYASNAPAWSQVITAGAVLTGACIAMLLFIVPHGRGAKIAEILHKEAMLTCGQFLAVSRAKVSDTSSRWGLA